MKGPRLDCMMLNQNAPRLVPADGRREWMDATHQHFANRCTPLTIANSSGWELINPVSVTITWNGYDGIGDVTIRINERGASNPHVTSMFGHGIVTFHPGYIFRTDPGWVVWARGSPNRLKDGIGPLDGIVETNWLPFTFTMNWRFTRPCSVTFEAGEPFCFITLVPSVAIEHVQPVIRPIESDPEFHREVKVWRSERVKFRAALHAGDEVSIEQKWQKFYLKGVSPSGKSVADGDHRAKRRLKAPVHADQLQSLENTSSRRGKPGKKNQADHDPSNAG